MNALPLVFSTGWATGVNCYLVVLVLGVADRVGDLTQVPDVLGSWSVLAVASVMYAMEFVADKIPLIDSTWDAVSTAIRPTAGAVIGVLLAGDATSLEPVTNIGASIAEDAAVLGVVWFAIDHPRAAAVIAGVLLAFGLVVLYLVAKVVRRGWRRWKGREPRAVRGVT